MNMRISSTIHTTDDLPMRLVLSFAIMNLKYIMPIMLHPTSMRYDSVDMVLIVPVSGIRKKTLTKPTR